VHLCLFSNPDSDEKDALFGLDTQITILVINILSRLKITFQ
jgi:hypothetical protein